MNLSETADLLTAMSAFDRRTIGDGDVVAWQAVLPDASFEDCLEAVKQHYAEQTDWIMPAHVRRAVRGMVSQREMAARATGWAPGQYGVKREEAIPVDLKPSAAECGAEIPRLALSDLPAAVAELVAGVRALLPEGSREALMPRRVAWEREHRAFQRQQDAESNPHYRPNPHKAPLPIPDADDPAREAWLRARGFSSHQEWVERDGTPPQQMIKDGILWREVTPPA